MKTQLKETYIPNVDIQVLLRKLLKLPLSALCELTLIWCKKFGTSSSKTNEQISERLDLLIQTKARRRILAKKILLEYWPNGLNLFQISQIDCYLLINKPNNYLWTSSTAWKSMNKKSVLSIDPDVFITKVQKELSRYYFSSLYIFKYPELPVFVCRIQLFDLNNTFLNSPISQKKSQDSSLSNGIPSNFNKSLNKELISRQPFYIAFPENSSTIIHSPDTDTYAQMILQSVQKAVSGRELILLKPDEDSAVRSLHNMNILKGVSRFSNSMGPWANYADGSFEISPLNQLSKHMSVVGKRSFNETDTEEDLKYNDVKMLKRRNNATKFKGSLNTDMTPSENKTEYYKSLVPIEKVLYKLKNTLPNSEDEIVIKFRLQGNDIFGGLHELADMDFIDVNKVPGWLAGENGLYSGTIRDGEFIKKHKSNGGLL